MQIAHLDIPTHLSDPHAVHSPSVLIVDDDPFIIRGLRRILNQQGIKAVGASNLKQATVALRYQDFAVVILDLVLGTERGETFRGTAPTHHKYRTARRWPAR